MSDSSLEQATIDQKRHINELVEQMQRSNELRDEKQKRKVAQLRRELQSQDAERIEADHEMLMRDVQVAWEVATRAEKAQREAEADQILHYVLGYSDDEGTQSVTEGQLRSELRQMTNTEQQSSHRVSELEQELAVLRDTAEMLSVELQASKNAQAQRHEMEDNGAEAIRKLERSADKRLQVLERDRRNVEAENAQFLTESTSTRQELEATNLEFREFEEDGVNKTAALEEELKRRLAQA
ncbi:unnamed protein product [Peronospora destructor]|uniref:Tropomyosin n=1 Tax=Peronospora destructor TaxID=86335 RepID=A0AAV0TQ46_9STRA|nr:unnamed protein product [Peronospora destructor]